MDPYLFIVGMPKCGTTALAHWLVEQGIAEYLIPEVKEPYVYSRSDFGSFCIPPGSGKGLWRLDASVAYALNPYAIKNMPEHSAKLIMCVRNPLERAWSNYKMHKFFTQKNNDWKKGGSEIFSIDGEDSRVHCEKVTTSSNRKKISKVIEKYYKMEGDRLLDGDFISRINYELEFYFTHGNFPFMDIVAGGRYSFALKNILEKYSPEDIVFLDVQSLEDSEKRKFLVQNFLERDKETDPIGKKWAGEAFEINEEKPDFRDPIFDNFRSFLAHDLKYFESQIDRYGISRDFIDFENLRRNIY